MPAKRHFDYAHRIESWSDPFNAVYLPRLAHFGAAAVERRVTNHLKRIEQKISAGCREATPADERTDEPTNP
jgi:hypothetical protein